MKVQSVGVFGPSRGASEAPCWLMLAHIGVMLDPCWINWRSEGSMGKSKKRAGEKKRLISIILESPPPSTLPPPPLHLSHSPLCRPGPGATRYVEENQTNHGRLLARMEPDVFGGTEETKKVERLSREIRAWSTHLFQTC